MTVLAHMGFDGWGIFMWLVSAAFWVLVALVIVALIRGGVGGRRAVTGTPAAVRILEERYARGEIPREEFIERRDVLSASLSPTPAPSEAPTEQSPAVEEDPPAEPSAQS